MALKQIEEIIQSLKINHEFSEEAEAALRLAIGQMLSHGNTILEIEQVMLLLVETFEREYRGK